MIQVCEPLFTGNEEKYAGEAIASTWIGSRGKYLERFEKEFPAYLGVAYGSLVTSGTTALHTGLLALGIQAGDEVILPAFTMIACAFAVCYCGAKPVFVDCEVDTWNMDPALIEAKITPRTKAIMVVHIYGHPCRMDEIMEIARAHKLAVIEDAAEAIGTLYKKKLCGGLADISCFSFFANKMITCGEGGMVCTDNKELYDRVRYFKNLCFPLDSPRLYSHRDIGFNYRMTNTHAAILCAQLEKVEHFTNCRREHAHAYNKLLAAIPGLTLPVEKEYAYNSYWMYGLLIEKEFGLTRDQVSATLKERGIDTRPFFISMHRQPSLQAYGCDSAGSYPVTDAIAEKGLYLPSGSGLKDEEIAYICNVMQEIRKA